MAKNITVIHDTGVKGARGMVDAVRIVRADAAKYGGRRIRLHVHRDGYDNQSYTHAQAWSGTAWETILKENANVRPLPDAYSTLAEMTKGFDAAMDDILDVALAVIA